MLDNLPFVPGRRTPIARCEIGSLIPDAASIQVKDTTHIDRIFTSGFGGGTCVDFKGFTITGVIACYVKRSGLSPVPASNIPPRFSRPTIKIWIGGYYAEGVGVITEKSTVAVTKAFTVIELSFESDGYWTEHANAVELY